ncbi:OmpA family protein [Pseudodesulfovibrio sediminis]|uniref:OmpA-like domain-containing protein n=1 Tax=Pseudodesulfovibrio sediminis TaxID=2810563 RepID=A0ABN6ESH1_9BACT|nr:OmpA family protein [Pseudodesulfovibrio sediminis]BCS89311.1 hypothetical protein PSDVSF_25530 [Pseudodesulfovibrio sediminis]
MKRIILITLFLMMLAGCNGQTVVLLPDMDGHVGTVDVTSETGETVTLVQANQAVKGKDTVVTMSDEDVQKTFGGAIAARPEPTAKFLLYFRSDSTTLTNESVKLFPEIMQAFHDRASTDVSVVGHADRAGDKDYNYKLSLRRANKVRAMLLDKGMPADVIQTISHGEENPIIPTADNKHEPKNRRVEVLVR